jgi:hypothetical protein
MSTANAVLTIAALVVVLGAIAVFGFIIPAWGVWTENRATKTAHDSEDERD